MGSGLLIKSIYPRAIVDAAVDSSIHSVVSYLCLGGTHWYLCPQFILMESILCPAGCGRAFDTSQGRESHLTQSRSCSWWQTFQKSSALDKVLQADVEEEALGAEYMMRQDEHGELLGELAGDLLQEYEEDNNIFHFVDLDPLIGQAGPGPSTEANRLLERQLGVKLRTLDDDSGEDQQVLEWQEDAGVIIRMDESLRARWQLANNLEVDVPMDGTAALPDQMYLPFASEMDWKIAEWVVKDGIGHKSLDRLLSIPGVSIL